MKIYEVKGEMAVPQGFSFDSFLEWFRKEIKHGNVHFDHTSGTLFVEVDSSIAIESVTTKLNDTCQTKPKK